MPIESFGLPKKKKEKEKNSEKKKHNKEWLVQKHENAYSAKGE